MSADMEASYAHPIPVRRAKLGNPAPLSVLIFPAPACLLKRVCFFLSLFRQWSLLLRLHDTDSVPLQC
jgi:hypothetical protein